VRLFVAAEPSDAVRRAAATCAAQVRCRLESAGAGNGLRWVPAENLHLTVWFLGEVSDPRAAAVVESLAPQMISPAFELQLAGLGAFPPSGPPRVLWIGVTRGVAELARAHDEVGERLAPWGFAPEGRSYSAHLTIARVKDPPRGAARLAFRDALTAERCEAGRCWVDTLTVFRSRTSPHGAAYESLLRVPLS
jgi:RNA 2',3'-cyclic 3'-phosphodiesterase